MQNPTLRSELRRLPRTRAIIHGRDFNGTGDDSAVLGLTALFDREQHGSPPTATPEAYQAFRCSIEAQLGSSLTVGFYTQQLGYSGRTISRASKAVTGLTAKGVLDQRIVLEGKRLLANTDDTAQSIGRQLGFTQPTNFATFFRLHTSQRPVEFRARVVCLSQGSQTRVR